MQFKNLSDESLQRVGTRIIRNVEARLRRQVPQRGKNPFATGRLQRSLQFDWGKEGGQWALSVSYDHHGVYTNYGTRNYNQYREQSFFGMGEYTRYRRGRGGIRPQWWLSLRGDRPVYEAIVEAELNMTLETFLNNTISGLKKQNR